MKGQPLSETNLPASAICRRGQNNSLPGTDAGRRAATLTHARRNRPLPPGKASAPSREPLCRDPRRDHTPRKFSRRSSGRPDRIATNQANARAKARKAKAGLKSF